MTWEQLRCEILDPPDNVPPPMRYKIATLMPPPLLSSENFIVLLFKVRQPVALSFPVPGESEDPMEQLYGTINKRHYKFKTIYGTSRIENNENV